MRRQPGARRRAVGAPAGGEGFDPLDPAFLDDPYPVYARLRDQGPLVRDGATQWIAARHEVVARLLREPRLRSQWPEPFQRMRIGEGAGTEFLVNVLLHREDGDHVRLRRLLGATMRTMPSAEVDAVVGQVTGEVLRRGLAGEPLDLVTDLALPVPVVVSAEMLGIPPTDRALVQQWGLEIIKAFTVTLPDQDRVAVAFAVEQMRAYLHDLLMHGPSCERLDAVRAVSEEQGGGTDPHELVDNLIFLLVSGFTTTVHVIGALGAVLLGRPDVVSQLRGNPALVPGAVEEVVRFDAPIQHVSRFAAEPVEVAGSTIRTGRVVHLLIGAANRDPRRFEHPEVLDVSRSPNPHLAFGAGLHTCLGAALGRREATVLLRHLLGARVDLEPTGVLRRRPIQVFRTYESLPCRAVPI